MNPSAVVTTAATAARQVLPPVLENRPLLRCEPEYGALVCLTCNNGFPRNPIARHLNERHGFTIDLYRPALRPFEHEALAQDWGDLVRPSDESAPIEGLKEPTPGFACTGCGHKTISERIAKGHLKCGQVRRVHLQRWNTRGDCEYWIVTPPPLLLLSATATATAITTATANGSCSQAGMFILRFTHCFFSFFFFLFLFDETGPSLQEIAIEKVLQREQRLEEEDESRRIEPNGKDDINLWDKFMKWTETFRGKDPG